MSAQVMISLTEKEDIEFEANDVLSLAPQKDSRRVEIVETFTRSWRPLGNIPDRQTDVFKGREQEIEEIRDWFDDVDSRACQVYGDGGIGKTTLAIECLHRLVEGTFQVAWRPDLIFYYTAKRTRWGVNGLEVINVAISGVSDALLSLKRGIEGNILEKDWYTASILQLSSRLSTLLSEYGIPRQNRLLVIDNAETLAQSAEEVKALSRSILEISRHVGRVLITSRRKEDIEARCIEALPLSEMESEDLLRARAMQLGIKSIQQAGGSTLRKYARKLGCKPLVLEVLIQILSDPATNIERGFNRVMQMQQQDLGEFLYSDAWHRMGDDLRHLLLLMARLGDVHDEVSLKLCANEASVSVLEAYRAIGESRGIASVTRIGGSAEVAFSQEFLRFCSARTIRIDGREEPSEDRLQVLRKRYQHFLASSTKQISDRMDRAFRHPLARAAYRAARDGNDQDAEIFYELAILSDQTNGALFDRYAYFLASGNKVDLAYDHAVHATQMEPREGEFWFTRGIVESRMNRAEDAIQSLQSAQRFGKQAHLCAYQSCYAYLKLNPPDYANARAAVQAAQKIAPNDPYRQKHLIEVEAMRKRIDSAMRREK
ncbi:MAG: AAA family ATPase [Lysobacterales bacterium]